MSLETPIRGALEKTQPESSKARNANAAGRRNFGCRDQRQDEPRNARDADRGKRATKRCYDSMLRTRASRRMKAPEDGSPTNAAGATHRLPEIRSGPFSESSYASREALMPSTSTLAL